MADQYPAGSSGRSGERRKIVVRLVAAAGLIVALLATLLILEQKKGEVASLPEKGLQAPVPDIGIAVASASSPSSLDSETQAELLGAPDMTENALVVLPDSESSGVAGVPEESSDVVSPTESLVRSSPVNVSRVAPRTGKSATADRLFVNSGETPPVATRPVPPPPAQLVVSSTLPVSALPPSFVLQLGVFSNPVNAEELRTRLREAGIPTQVETRVQVGPFANRDEAVRAQEKLLALGLGKGMLLPVRKP